MKNKDTRYDIKNTSNRMLYPLRPDECYSPEEVKSTSDRLKPAQEYNNKMMDLLRILENASVRWAEKELNKEEIRVPNPLDIEMKVHIVNSKGEGSYTHYESMSIEEILEHYGEHLTLEEKEQLVTYLENGNKL